MIPVTLPVAHIRQRVEGECLVACAAMVLDYLSVPVAYGQLLKLLRINETAPIAVSLGDFDLAWLERDEYYATFLRRE